jgi:hypothetical protein
VDVSGMLIKNVGRSLKVNSMGTSVSGISAGFGGKTACMFSLPQAPLAAPGSRFPEDLIPGILNFNRERRRWSSFCVVPWDAGCETCGFTGWAMATTLGKIICVHTVKLSVIKEKDFLSIIFDKK